MRLRALVLCAAALAVAAFVAHAGALDNDLLLWDDDVHVTKNPHIRSLSPSSLLWMWSTFEADNWHPLAWLSHALDHAIFGLDPWGHHLTSVLLHCGSTVWLFLLSIATLQIVADPTRGPDLRRRTARPSAIAAGVAALLLGLHPQHVESVVWVAERKDVLCLFFVLPTLLSYLYYATAPTPSSRRRWYAVCVAAFACAVVSKPQSVVVPALLCLLDVYPLRRVWGPAETRAPWRTLLLEKVPFVTGALLLAGLTLAAQTRALVSTQQVGMGFRILNAFQGLVHYLAKLFVPVGLDPIYPPPPGYRGFFQNLPEYLPAIGAVLATTAFCLFQWRRGRRWWLAIWAFYVVSLAPVLGLVRVGDQIAADRYAYLPLLPVYLLIGVGVARIAERGRAWRLAAVVAVLVVATGLGFLTRQQTRIWGDDFSFWGHLVARHPERAMHQAGLAYAYLLAGDPRAIEHFQRALEIDPDDYAVRFNLAWSHRRHGQLAEAEAVLRGILRDGLADGARGRAVRLQLAELACARGDTPEARRLARELRTRDGADRDASALLERIERGGCRGAPKPAPSRGVPRGAAPG